MKAVSIATVFTASPDDGIDVTFQDRVRLSRARSCPSKEAWRDQKTNSTLVTWVLTPITWVAAAHGITVCLTLLLTKAVLACFEIPLPIHKASTSDSSPRPSKFGKQSIRGQDTGLHYARMFSPMNAKAVRRKDVSRLRPVTVI